MNGGAGKIDPIFAGNVQVRFDGRLPHEQGSNEVFRFFVGTLVLASLMNPKISLIAYPNRV